LERLDEPGRDLSPVEDALGAAFLLRASSAAGLDDLRRVAVRERIWPRRSRARTVIATVLATAAAAAILALWPRGSAELPGPNVKLLRAQLAAAQPGAPATLDPLSAEMNGYRAQVYASFGRAYGARR